MVGRVAPGRAMSFAELEAAGVEGLLIAPDDRSREAMGANHFDPSRRGPAAVAAASRGGRSLRKSAVCGSGASDVPASSRSEHSVLPEASPSALLYGDRS